MRLLKSHSHNSNGLDMKPGNREQNQLKENADRTTRQATHQNLSRAAGVAGEAAGTGKALRQTNHRKGTMSK